MDVEDDDDDGSYVPESLSNFLSEIEINLEETAAEVLGEPPSFSPSRTKAGPSHVDGGAAAAFEGPSEARNETVVEVSPAASEDHPADEDIMSQPSAGQNGDSPFSAFAPSDIPEPTSAWDDENEDLFAQLFSDEGEVADGGAQQPTSAFQENGFNPDVTSVQPTAPSPSPSSPQIRQLPAEGSNSNSTPRSSPQNDNVDRLRLDNNGTDRRLSISSPNAAADPTPEKTPKSRGGGLFGLLGKAKVAPIDFSPTTQEKKMEAMRAQQLQQETQRREQAERQRMAELEKKRRDEIEKYRALELEKQQQQQRQVAQAEKQRAMELEQQRQLEHQREKQRQAEQQRILLEEQERKRVEDVAREQEERDMALRREREEVQLRRKEMREHLEEDEQHTQEEARLLQKRQEMERRMSQQIQMLEKQQENTVDQPSISEQLHPAGQEHSEVDFSFENEDIAVPVAQNDAGDASLMDSVWNWGIGLTAAAPPPPSPMTNVDPPPLPAAPIRQQQVQIPPPPPTSDIDPQNQQHLPNPEHAVGAQTRTVAKVPETTTVGVKKAKLSSRSSSAVSINTRAAGSQAIQNSIPVDASLNKKPESSTESFWSRMTRGTAASNAKHSDGAAIRSSTAIRPSTTMKKKPPVPQIKPMKDVQPSTKPRSEPSRLLKPTSASKARAPALPVQPPPKVTAKNFTRSKMPRKPAYPIRTKGKEKSSVADGLEQARLRRARAESERLDRIEKTRKDREDQLAAHEKERLDRQVQNKPVLPKRVKFKPTIPVPPKFATDSRLGTKDHPIKPVKIDTTSKPTSRPLSMSTSAPKRVPTIPLSPKFATTRRRELPKSTAERELELMAKSKQFKAIPVRMNASSSVTTRPKSKRRTTMCEPFQFSMDIRATRSREAEDEDFDIEAQHTFRARPMPNFSKAKILPPKTPDSKKRPVTKPRPFHLSSDLRSRAGSSIRTEDTLGKKVFKARPMPDFSQAPSVHDSGGRIRSARKVEIPEETTPFKARPMPDFSSKGKLFPKTPISSKKPLTTPTPFKLQSAERAKLHEEKSYEEPPREFHARPPPKFSEPSIPVTPRDPTKIRSPPTVTNSNSSPDRAIASKFRARPAPKFASPLPVKSRDPSKLRSPDLVMKPPSAPPKTTSPQFKARKMPNFPEPLSNGFKSRPVPTSSSAPKATRSSHSGARVQFEGGVASASKLPRSGVKPPPRHTPLRTPPRSTKKEHRSRISNGVPTTITFSPCNQSPPPSPPTKSPKVDESAFEEQPDDVFAFQEPVVTPRSSPPVIRTGGDHADETTMMMQQSEDDVMQPPEQVISSEEKLRLELQVASEQWMKSQGATPTQDEQDSAALNAVARQRDAIQLAHQLQRAADDEISFGTRSTPRRTPQNPTTTMPDQKPASLFSFLYPPGNA